MQVKEVWRIDFPSTSYIFFSRLWEMKFFQRHCFEDTFQKIGLTQLELEGTQDLL